MQILDLNRLSNQKPWMGLWAIHIVLDLSWDEIRAVICSLRSVLGGEHQKIRTILVGLLCSDLSSGTTPVARGLIRLIQKIGTGDLPWWFWQVDSYNAVAVKPTIHQGLFYAWRMGAAHQIFSSLK